jgi:Phosphoesterase family
VHLPSSRVVGAAVLLMLGFGIAIGTAAGPHANATLASATSQRRVVVVVQPPAAPATTTAAESKAGTTPKPKAKPKPAPAASNEDSSEPAAAAPTPTPEPKEKQETSGDDEDAAGSGSSDDEKENKPTIKHVWIVALTGHTMDEALADPSPMPYLAGTLRPKGLLLSKYKAVTTGGLANLIALISGQKPTADQQAGCAAYNDVDPRTRVGCVFDKEVDTLPGQLTAAGRTWRGYVEDSDAGQPPDTCRHPAPGGPLEPVMARNPFLFFHAIVDGDCAPNVAGMSRLAPDAADAESAPTMSLVVPNACHDGRDQPCAEGAPAGVGAADLFLLQQIGPLLKSKAYEDDGMIVVTFDAGTDPSKPVGALLISDAVKAGGTDDGAYDHVALLRTLEDLFALDPLGEAKDAKAMEVTNASP